METFITGLPGFIGSAVEANPLLGYLAIALVMLMENIFPPIPSELVMPLGGYLVYTGKLQLVPVVIAGLLGTVLGAWFWYGIGRLINEEKIESWLRRHGGWLGIKADDLAKSRRWFGRHGVAVVFWGRLIPGVRTLVSVPAGIELMPQVPFLLWTSAGSLLWVLMLTLAGQAMGSGYASIEHWLEPVTKGIKVLLVVVLVGALSWLGSRLLKQRQR